MYKEQLDAYFSDKEPLLVDAVCRLVSIDSTEGRPMAGAPFGPGPAAALEEALKLAGEWGLIARNHEGFVGTADLCDKEDALHILGHLDVVVPGEGWTVTAPFSPRIVDGMIYGRGTDDDKGPVVASLLAMKAVKDLEIPLKANCRCILGTNEESGSGDIKWYFARYPFAPATFSPDSGFPVYNTEKGSLRADFRADWPVQQAMPRLCWLHGGIRRNILPGEASAALEGISPEEVSPYAAACTARTKVTFRYTSEDGLTIIRAEGTGTHAAHPEEGCNAITGLVELLCALPLADGPCKDHLNALKRLMPHGDCHGKAIGIAQEDTISGKLTLAFSLLEVTQTGLQGSFDARVPLCATEENCCKVARAALEAGGFQVDAHQKPPHHTPPDSAFVQTLLKRYTQYSGKQGRCISTGGGTYVHDIPGGVAFGCTLPGFDTHLHGADERVRIADLMMSAKIFAHIIIDLCAE